MAHLLQTDSYKKTFNRQISLKNLVNLIDYINYLASEDLADRLDYYVANQSRVTFVLLTLSLISLIITTCN